MHDKFVICRCEFSKAGLSFQLLCKSEASRSSKRIHSDRLVEYCHLDEYTLALVRFVIGSQSTSQQLSLRILCAHSIRTSHAPRSKGS